MAILFHKLRSIEALPTRVKIQLKRDIKRRERNEIDIQSNTSQLFKAAHLFPRALQRRSHHELQLHIQSFEEKKKQ